MAQTVADGERKRTNPAAGPPNARYVQPSRSAAMFSSTLEVAALHIVAKSRADRRNGAATGALQLESNSRRGQCA
jgi:hypothetical protein